MQSGPTAFPAHDMSNLRSVSVSVGPIVTPVTGNNRIVQVEDQDLGSVIGHPFIVQPSGSGSSGSGPTPFPLRKFCRQPVPVALSLKLDASVTRGTCPKCNELNRPMLLLYAENAPLPGSWFSRPIAFCGKGAPVGFWVLERKSTTMWTLVLKQGDNLLVTFTARTKPKDCSLPINLQRKGAGSKVCKDWPKSVTISPAS